MATSTEDRLVEALGPDIDKLKIREDALKLMGEGVIVQLHVGRWRARKSLSLEDLGIETVDTSERKVLAEYVELGQQRLLPSDWLSALDTLESTSRKVLDKYSFKTAWGTFVPFTAYETVKRRLEEYRGQYMALADRIYAEYDVLTDRVRQDYRVAAQHAYRVMMRQAWSAEVQAPEEFIQAFVDAIMVCVPSRERIRESFGFDIKLSYVPIIGADYGERWDKVSESMYQASLKIEKAATVQQRERQLREMQRDLAAQARADKERYLDGFMESLSGQLRRTILEAVSNVRDSMERNGKLGWKNVEQLRNLLAQVEALNFTGETDITEQLAALKAALPADERSAGCDPAEVGRVLGQIAASSKARLLAMGDDLRSGRRTADEGLGVGEDTPQRRGKRKVDDVEDLSGFEVKRKRVRLRDFLPQGEVS